MKSLILASILALSLAGAATAAEPVAVQTFVRAETDHMFAVNQQAMGLVFGEVTHQREAVTPANQTVIRSNQDTLYSAALLDLSQPAFFTLPDAGDRFISMHVINQDHYMFVEAEPGTYELTEDEVGTRFAFVLVRTFADVTDPDDVAAAHAVQDGLGVRGGGPGPLEAPDWSTDDLALARKALSDLATLGFDAQYAFGRKEETRPIDHLIGAAAGWGGQPKSAAMYVIDSVDLNDGTTPHEVTVRDVPVDAFWSVTVYDADGYLAENELGINSYNNFTAEPNDDGSFTISFAPADSGRPNCIPISPGWNYAVRLYEPRAEILDGTWTFPKPHVVQ